VRVISLGAVPRRSIDSFGSRGFAVGALGLTADAHLVVVSLRPGGVIGRHPAAGRQVLVVVDGDAQVSGADGSTADLGSGEAAVWEPGEEHETRSRGGVTAFVVEGDIEIGTPSVATDAP
jgi:mannose-6-phosphate isomerase-like protein (cupin superfamily)